MALRDELIAAGYTTGRSRQHNVVVARDGTQKLLRQLADGRVVETVGIPADDADRPRLTACVSSQVRCAEQLLGHACVSPQRSPHSSGAEAQGALSGLHAWVNRACMQVGCPMRCTFCATGKGGYARNLAAHEIVDQVLAVQETFGKRVSNVGARLALHSFLALRL
jgi:23S rRNA (adenine2503-C2)-methyltransferase